MTDVILWYLTDDVMILFWALEISFVLFVTAKSKVPTVVVLSLPGVVWLAFYVWTHFGWWDSVAAAQAWSRIAHLITIGSITYGLWRMVGASRIDDGITD